MTILTLTSSCRREGQPPGLEAQVTGTVELTGLSATVRVVRDRWGVPHVYAQTRDDLFAAQGFVQAQDRLFQMDLWRRAAQGRLAEVLGPNFVERDAMTRRFQYRGGLDAEWASYGPDTLAIATAFTRGINAWVARARERPPEQFALAGWKPDFWAPSDLLNRTDAFLESGDAIDQVRREQFSDVVADAIRRVGTPPFFVGLAAPVRQPASRQRSTGSPSGSGSNPASTSNSAGGSLGSLTHSPNSTGSVFATRGRLELSEARRQFDHPSARYFIHLTAPGWNVVGATAPWLPGVAVGHNERAAWGMVPIEVDTQDVYLHPADPSTIRVLTEALMVKGRRSPFFFDIQLTSRGVIVASDREHNRAFSVRWSGTELGAAAGLAALALDRAQTWLEFRQALSKWKVPSRRVAYADVDGVVAAQDAAFVPRRQGQEWVGWLTLDDLAHFVNPPGGAVRASGASARRELEGSQQGSAGQRGQAVYSHVLGVTDAARRRFTIGPLNRPVPDDSPVRAIFTLHDWDRSQALNTPGQSEAADSPHFRDHAILWSEGKTFPLAFSESAVRANAEATLILAPPQRTR